MNNSSASDPPLSDGRLSTLRVLRVMGAILSIFGSMAIITHVLKGKRYRKSSMQRLVLGLSIVDVLYSSHLAIAASFIYPIYEPSTLCTTDAFFMMLGQASPLYNAALSYYYCMTVVGGVSNERFARRYEPFFHIGVFVVAFATAILGLFFEIYNPKPSGLGCWAVSYPSGCQLDDSCERGGTTSERIVQYIGSILPMAFSLLSTIITNIILYCSMRRLEKRNRRYTFRASTTTTAATPDGTTTNSNTHNSGIGRRWSMAVLRASAVARTAGLFRRSSGATTSTRADRQRQQQQQRADKSVSVSRQMATQSFFYVGAFLMSYGCGLVNFAVLSAANGKTIFPLQAINFFLYPAQGFLNALVYLRPNYLRWREAGDSRLAAIQHALFSLRVPRRRQRPGPQQEQQQQPTRQPRPPDVTDSSNTEEDKVVLQGSVSMAKQDDGDEESSASSESCI